MPLSGLFKALNDIQFIQKFLQGVAFEKVLVAHRLLDIGEKDKSNELDKELAVQIFIG